MLLQDPFQIEGDDAEIARRPLWMGASWQSNRSIAVGYGGANKVLADFTDSQKVLAMNRTTDTQQYNRRDL